MPVSDPEAPVAFAAKPSILARTTRGAGWIFGFRIFTRILGSVSNIILAALLLPADFGIWAMGITSLQMIETLSYVGVEDALVREKTPGRDMYDTAFTLNLVRGALIAVILVIAARPVAAFYSEPGLSSLIMALAAATLLDAGGNIAMVDLRRNFEFDREFIWLAVPRVLQVVVMIAVALLTRSYWALAAGVLVNRGAKLAMGYRMQPFRPRLSLGAWRHLLGFSAWTWAVSVAVLLRDQAPKWLIGRLLPVKYFGMFAFGTDLAAMPITELVVPMSRAAFSGFSVARHEGEASGETYLRVVSLVAVVTLPLGVGLSLLADPLVRLALGIGWIETVPLISIVSLLSSFAVYGYLGWTLFFAHGRLRLVFGITVVSALVRFLLMLWLLPTLQLMAAALAVFVASVVEDFAYIVLVRIYFAASFATMWQRNWRFLFATAAMAAGLYGAGLGWVPVIADRGALTLHLLGAMLLGALLYSGALLALWALSGRPDGTEADLVRFAGGKLAGWRKLWR